VTTLPDGAGVLSGRRVKDAMRRPVASLDREASLEAAMARLIKYKLGALLVTDEADRPVGVVSRSDLVLAYYAALPLTASVREIMFTQPEFCAEDEGLAEALGRMRDARIHRLFVTGPDGGVVGTLSYNDVVGLLYRLCRRCDRSLYGRTGAPDPGDPVRVNEVMTPGVTAHPADDTLAAIMDGLFQTGQGAVLIVHAGGGPVGVVSKSDLMLAYRHQRPVDSPAEAIMSAPVQVCGLKEPLLDAIHRMIFPDVHRLFVHDPAEDRIVGVVSLSDAMRFWSGSCKACRPARIEIDPGG
jgi:predicted transcriptional regulator